MADSRSLQITDDEPPRDLHKYCEWGLDKSSPGPGPCRYQFKLMSLLGNFGKFYFAYITYLASFTATEPEVGGPSGRTLVGGGSVCSEPLYANSPKINATCPELPNDCAVINGLERDSWAYRDMENSVTASFDVTTCSPGARKTYLPLVGTLFWACYGVGVSFGGVLSDRTGRRVASTVSLLVMMVTNLISGLAPNFLIWGFGRALSGAGVGVYTISILVWQVESLHRTTLWWMPWYPTIGFILGASMVSVVALYVQDWSTHTLIAAAMGLPNLVWPSVFHETPKWLAAQGQGEKLSEVLNDMAAMNGQPALPPPLPSKNSVVDDLSGDQEQVPASVRERQKSGFTDLFGPKILSRTLVMSFIWFTGSFSYYGLNLVSRPPDVFENPTMSYIWGFALEFPGYFLGGLLMETQLGRKISTTGGIGIAGVLLLCFSVKESVGETGKLIIDILYYPARFGVTLAFIVITIWSAELFPSSIRQTAMGVNSSSARLGSMITPWLAPVPFPVKMTIFAFPCIVSAVLGCIFLPETRGKPLPGRVRDLE